MTKLSGAVSESFKKKVKRNVAENFDRSYPKYQAFEDRHRFFYTLALKLADSLDLQPETAVLDVGCGNGISARALNDHFGCRVLGVDLSEKMVAAGQALSHSPDISLVVGDGERLVDLADGQQFDYVLYNASIFIFPDVDQTFREACACLRPGGKIGFSFYPELVGPEGEDLMRVAFSRLGEPMPHYKVVTRYSRACRVLENICGHITRHRWERPLDLGFLKDFFSIPAQSASLFPGLEYEARLVKVSALLATLADMVETGAVAWRMAEGTKVNTET